VIYVTTRNTLVTQTDDIF